MSIPFSKLNPDIPLPDRLGLIAGRGAYPLLLAESAKRQGVRHLMAVAFRRETNPAINRLADEVHWLKFGQLEIMLETLRNADIKQAVMAGQITPTSLFRLRPDRRSLQILSGLRARNAHTIFGAVCAELQNIGVTLLPAWRFMENAMPTPGRLSTREPTERERSDIELGLRTAKAISGLDIGQTVAVKDGVILAVEGFEGTDAALLRAGKLGGPGMVAVKVAKQGHDMRFDIPIIGTKTIAVLKRAGASALAVEAGRTILLEREQVIRAADRINLTMIAVTVDHGPN